MEGIEIVDTDADNILEYGVCGYKNIKRAGYPEKIEWLILLCHIDFSRWIDSTHRH